MSIVKLFKGHKILASAEFVTLFKNYDKDGNGLIDASELETFLKDFVKKLGSDDSLKCNITQLKEQILKKYDTNQDGKLSMEEMIKILPTEKNFLLNLRTNVKITAAEFMKIWYHYDLDKSGYLEGSEIEGFIHDFLKKNNKDISPAAIQDQKTEVLENIDANKDGKISLSEFFELLPVEENFFRIYEDRDSLNPKDFEDIFNHYDKDKNGEIEDKELQDLLKDIMERDGMKPNTEDLESYKKEILGLVDTNKDGKISKQELSLFLCTDE